MFNWNPNKAALEHSPKLEREIKLPNLDTNLKDAYRIAAKVVSRYGDQYLPIFERLDSEIEDQMKKQSLLKKAFSVSEDIDR